MLRIASVALPLSAATLAASCAALVTRSVTPVDGTLRLALTHYPELAERNGSLRVLPVGSTDPVYVFAMEGGQFAALSSVCTHLQCTVEVSGDRLVCPCHGSTYSRTGAVLVGPAERPLQRYRTELTSDGVLVVRLGERT